MKPVWPKLGGESRCRRCCRARRVPAEGASRTGDDVLAAGELGSRDGGRSDGRAVDGGPMRRPGHVCRSARPSCPVLPIPPRSHSANVSKSSDRPEQPGMARHAVHRPPRSHRALRPGAPGPATDPARLARSGLARVRRRNRVDVMPSGSNRPVAPAANRGARDNRLHRLGQHDGTQIGIAFDRARHRVQGVLSTRARPLSARVHFAEQRPPGGQTARMGQQHPDRDALLVRSANLRGRTAAPARRDSACLHPRRA